MISTTALFKEEGREPGERILRIAREPASEQAVAALQLEKDATVVDIERVRYADGVPVLIERLVFPLKFGERFLSLAPNSESVHQQLANSNVRIDNVVRTGRIQAADAMQAKLLDIEAGSPLWRLELRASTFQGEHVEYAEYFFRADMLSLSMSNVRGGSVPLKFDVVDPGATPRSSYFNALETSE